ncbi:MAG TPA: amidohydrolase family protein [Candidatus Binataceae bacterium]|nr:amidohydrolase family protein [Candidatus Binataceae bacterium]
MASVRLISADSHVVEPADLWMERLDRAFKDRAPRVVPNEGRPGVSLIAPGILPFPIASLWAAGKGGLELAAHMVQAHSEARRSGWDPVERIKDQDIDGVEAEVIYPSLAMPLFGLTDAELQQACFRIYNDWLADYCSHNPKRLIGIGLISLFDIDAGIRELERCRKLALRGAMIWGAAPRDRPYGSPAYDPFWQAASDLNMPLSLHVLTGGELKGPTNKLTGDILRSGPEAATTRQVGGYIFMTVDVQFTLVSLVLNRVLERFPALKIVSAENDTGWLPHFMYRMDHAYEKYWNVAGMRQFEMKPSDFLRRNLRATFQDDPIGPATYDYFGADNYMWASDFPHSDSTWPNSREVVRTDFARVPEEVTRKMVFDNAAQLYGIALD